MQINDKIIELKKNLPKGSYKEISKRTGFTEKTVGKFFKGCNSRYRTYVEIIKVSNDIINEIS